MANVINSENIRLVLQAYSCWCCWSFIFILQWVMQTVAQHTSYDKACNLYINPITNTKEDGNALQLLLWTASQLCGWARLKAIESKKKVTQHVAIMSMLMTMSLAFWTCTVSPMNRAYAAPASSDDGLRSWANPMLRLNIIPKVQNGSQTQLMLVLCSCDSLHTYLPLHELHTLVQSIESLP